MATSTATSTRAVKEHLQFLRDHKDKLVDIILEDIEKSVPAVQASCSTLSFWSKQDLAKCIEEDSKSTKFSIKLSMVALQHGSSKLLGQRDAVSFLLENRDDVSENAMPVLQTACALMADRNEASIKKQKRDAETTARLQHLMSQKAAQQSRWISASNTLHFASTYGFALTQKLRKGGSWKSTLSNGVLYDLAIGGVTGQSLLGQSSKALVSWLGPKALKWQVQLTSQHPLPSQNADGTMSILRDINLSSSLESKSEQPVESGTAEH